ncbi:MAG: GNAT family N-acetyltransferase [Coriobacteriales bacterium]|nr:GNAT family N-acetyltransferase [Coriobacteriales bacterium]
MTTPRTEPLFTIRPAAERDEPYLEALFLFEEMPTLPLNDLLTGSVAVNSDDEPVGFIRIFTVDDKEDPAKSGHYIYPVIVFEQWRHHGVAAALVDYELRRRGSLKLVACRPSRGFYERTGFAREDWSNIADPIAADCQRCPDQLSCDPVPYVKR